MNWKQYKLKVAKLAIYQRETEIEYLSGQLVSECAEFMAILNKCYRKYGKQAWDMFRTKHRDAAILELGDIYWYLARFSDVLNFEYKIKRPTYQHENYQQQIHGLVESAVMVNQQLIADETLWGDNELQISLAIEDLIDCYNLSLLFLAPLDTTLDEVCDRNIQKLKRRRTQGKLTSVVR